MELRQLRYFVKVCESGSLGRAALELGVVVSALSRQISRLESELATRLLNRKATGVAPTEGGLAFLQQARLTLRHADEAMHAAQQARLSGRVSVGLAPTTMAMLGLPLIDAMRERHPQVRLCLVEALSGHLSAMLNARELDMALLFGVESARRWNVLPLLNEQLFLIAPPALAGLPVEAPKNQEATVRLAQLAHVPLVLPSSSHGLRAILTAAFAHERVTPHVVAEIDSLNLLMDTVCAGHGATIQPGAAMARAGQLPGANLLRHATIADAKVNRRNFVVSLSDEELSPAALVTRVVLIELVRKLVRAGRWAGATLDEN